MLGKRIIHSGYLIHLPTHCMPCLVLFVCGAWGWIHSPAPAHLSPFSPQTQAPRCLQTPQLRAQAQSPLCHLHSEKPASHLSPSLPMEITVPGTALPHYWDPPSARRAHHYVRKAPPVPSPPPPCPAEVCSFISNYYPRTSD